VLNTSQS